MHSYHFVAIIVVLMTSYQRSYGTAELSESSPLDDEASAISNGFLFQEQTANGNPNSFPLAKQFVSDGSLSSPTEEDANHAREAIVPSRVFTDIHGDQNIIPLGDHEFPTGSSWNGGAKRFNEFLGKRSAHHYPYPRNVLSKLLVMKSHPSAMKSQPISDEAKLMKIMSSSGGDPRVVLAKLLASSDSRQREILVRLFRNVYRMMTSKDTPKRQYEFVGKRFDPMNTNSLIKQIEVSDDEDDQNKRYEFLGKKNYDFLGKKSYDFLGKKSYDFLGKKSYDFLGKKSYDFLGKRDYDFLGKRPYVGDKRNYDFLGKRPYVDLGDKRNYDFLGKRKDDAEGDDMEVSQAGKGDNSGRDFDASSFEADMYSPHVNPHHAHRRYSEWLGKRKRSSVPLSTQQRLAYLLRDNTLRKRLSRMLMGSRNPSQHSPEFIGK